MRDPRDALRRRDEDQQVKITQQPLRENDFLLITAAERADVSGNRRRFDVKLIAKGLDGAAFAQVVDEDQRPAKRLHRGQRDVLADAQVRHDSFELAMLGQQATIISEIVKDVAKLPDKPRYLDNPVYPPSEIAALENDGVI